MGLFGKRKKDPRRETIRAARLADKQHPKEKPEEGPTWRNAKLNAVIMERAATLNETHTRRSR